MYAACRVESRHRPRANGLRRVTVMRPGGGRRDRRGDVRRVEHVSDLEPMPWASVAWATIPSRTSSLLIRKAAGASRGATADGGPMHAGGPVMEGQCFHAEYSAVSAVTLQREVHERTAAPK